MSYSILLEKNVLKYLKKIETEKKARILQKIRNLENNPVPSNVKRIVNVKDKVFRMRVGAYRILYRIEDNKLIIIFLVKKRDKAYLST